MGRMLERSVCLDPAAPATPSTPFPAAAATQLGSAPLFPPRPTAPALTPAPGRTVLEELVRGVGVFD